MGVFCLQGASAVAAAEWKETWDKLQNRRQQQSQFCWLYKQTKIQPKTLCAEVKRGSFWIFIKLFCNKANERNGSKTRIFHLSVQSVQGSKIYLIKTTAFLESFVDFLTKVLRSHVPPYGILWDSRKNILWDMKKKNPSTCLLWIYLIPHSLAHSILFPHQLFRLVNNPCPLRNKHFISKLRFFNY